MKLTVKTVLATTEVLASIINEKRSMPQRGKYLIARMHAKLLPEYNIIHARQTEMIKAYGNPQMRPIPGQVLAEGELPLMEPIPNEWQVPVDKLPEYADAWKTVLDEEIDVDVQPMPLLSISLPNGSDGSIEAVELITLGDLVFDTAA